MKSIKNKKLVICFLLLILIVIGFVFILEKRGVINLYDQKPSIGSSDAETTSTAPTAQANFSDGEQRDPGNTQAENKGSAVIIDSNGSFTPPANTQNSTSSRDGTIILYTPERDSLLKNGTIVSGTASTSTVSYRLIDDISGVIAMGQLSVQNGKFSGAVSYNTNAKEGRLDIYSTKEDGVEFANIEVPVRFK